MRDLPPTSQPGEQLHTTGHQAAVYCEAEGTGSATNGRLSSLPGTPSLPRPTPCNPTGSPAFPHRPSRMGPDSVFQPPPLRRQLITQESLDCPLSPASRPRSPWGRFDPYDSPEVCFCYLCVCFFMMSVYVLLSVVMLSVFVMVLECLEIEKMVN